MRKGKPVRLAGEQAKCHDCGAEFEGGRFAKFCPVCRPLNRRSKRAKYVLDGTAIALLRDRYDSRVRGRVAEIAQKLGWPKWAVKKAAIKLGLATEVYNRKAWTPGDVAFVEQWAGTRSAKWIARKLVRTHLSVVNKIKRLDLSRRITNGYSTREVSECFGIDSHTVDKWVKRGWLRPTEFGINRYREGWTRFSDTALRAFVRSHPLEFRLDKVDQVWFLGLVLGTPVDVEAERECTQKRGGSEKLLAKNEEEDEVEDEPE